MRALTPSQQLLHWFPVRQLDYEMALHQQLSCFIPLTSDYFLLPGIFWSVSLSLFTLEKLLIACSDCRKGCNYKLSAECVRWMPVPKMVLNRLCPCVCWQQTQIHLWFCCITADIYYQQDIIFLLQTCIFFLPDIKLVSFINTRPSPFAIEPSGITSTWTHFAYHCWKVWK